MGGKTERRLEMGKYLGESSEIDNLSEVRELKECPFCGSNADLFAYSNICTTTVYYKAGCSNPQCLVKPGISKYISRLDAIADWNTRTELRIT